MEIRIPRQKEYEGGQGPQESYKTGWLVTVVNLRTVKVLGKMTLVIKMEHRKFCEEVRNKT